MFPFSTLVLTDMGSSWLIFHLGLVEGWIAVVIFHVPQIPQYKTGWFNSSTLPSVSIYGIPGEYRSSHQNQRNRPMGDLHPTDLRFENRML